MKMLKEEFLMEVYNAVKECPNRRARQLKVNAWVPEISLALHELKRQGKVTCELVREIGNAEEYYIWRAK